MLVEIKNDFLTAVIDTFGAELKSVKGNGGTEFMWCADPEIWGESAPVLFPICGGLRGGKYEHEGKVYELMKHGFAKRNEFECTKTGDADVDFVFCSNKETLKMYPFKFEFHVIFKLDGKKLITTYKVINKGENTMYFSVGAHEGFACPEGINKYTITFDKDDCLNMYRADSRGVIDEIHPFPLEERSFTLNKDMFFDDALIFFDHKSRRVILTNTLTGKKVTVDFDGFDYLLFWTKPEGDYICVEPWIGMADTDRCTGKLSEKEGIMSLAGGCEFSADHIITFEE